MTTTSRRPLSPHLQIYKPQLTSIMSIMHRLTGVFLTLGTLLLVYWLIAIASGPERYQYAQQFFGNHWVLMILLGWSLALYYHMCNGIRHLFWDAGLGFELKTAYTSAKWVWVFTLTLTALTWGLAL